MAENPPGPSKKWWRKIRTGFWKNWIDFGEALWQSVIEPFGQPAFIFYFLGIIIVVGSLGVTISLYDAVATGTLTATHAVPRSLSTYLLAILATAFVDLTLTVETQSKRSLKMFALLTLVLGTVGGTIALLTLNVKLAYICALIGTFMALSLWWIANSKNEKLFEPNPSPTAPLGENSGDMPGSLEGIKT
jgi:hypothetical protein